MADIAADLIADARNYASNAQSEALVQMESAQTILQGLTGYIGTDPFKGINLKISPPPPGDPGDVPGYAGIHLDPDPFTVLAPTLGITPPYVAPTLPVDNFTDLVYNDPTNLIPMGLAADESLILSVPTINDLPTAPTMPNLEAEIQGITAPVLTNIVIPDAPTYVAPEFTGTAPTFDATVPTDLDLAYASNYSTASPIMQAAVTNEMTAFMNTNFPQFATAMTAIETRLATYLAGGTALTPAVEDGMYNRTLDKTNKDAVRASQEAWQKAARAGHTIPPATLLSQLQDVDQERRYKNAMAATEIYIKQAELEQNNLQFAVKASSELRKIALDAGIAYFHGLVTINGHALEYARGVVESIVKAFDVAARYAETQARIYEADAAVYRAKLEGALAQLHAYEATVRGLEATANVERAEVDAYTARINAVRAEAEVYRTAVDAVVALGQLERIKVDLYSAKVHAYGEQVNAYTARWNGYAAAVKGQASKMEVNVAKAREFEARFNAYVAQVRGAEATVNAQLSINKNLIDQYLAQVKAYSELEHAKAESVSIDVGVYKATIDAYNAKANAIYENAKAVTANYEVALRGLIAEANVQLELLREYNHMRIVGITQMAGVSKEIGQQYADLSKAALSGMNTLAADVVNSTV